MTRPVDYPITAARRADTFRLELDRMVREALIALRSSCKTPPQDASQTFTDVVKGRAVGTLVIARMLIDAHEHEAPKDAGRAVAHAILRFVDQVWADDDRTLFETLDHEARVEGEANFAQQKLNRSPDCPSTIDEATQLLQQHRDALDDSLEALAERRARV